MSGCSLYQSDGRKFLEKQALQFSRAAATNLQSCGAEPLSEEWLKTSEDERVEVYASDARDFTLRVVPRTTDGVYSCTYQFASVQEMIERTDSAVDLTLEQMALGLVP
jgi:hypothetical protein